MTSKASISHAEVIVEKLRKSHSFAVEYLKATLADVDEPAVLPIALRHIVEARGGVVKVAKAAGIEREGLRRDLQSSRGNPRLTTLFAVTKALGLTLTVETPAAKS